MKLKVFLICTGLGVINRGYESFTRECYECLKDEKDIDLKLFKGGGKTGRNEYVLPSFKREHKMTHFLSRISGKERYYLEQLSFFFFLLPYVFIKRPQVIYFSDFYLGCWLSHMRRWTGIKFRLLFSNGAPNGPPFDGFDMVQQLLRYHYDIALAGGEPPARHEVVPYGVKVDRKLSVTNSEIKAALKNKLNIPAGKKIILSVGALNSSHKRMDHLIKEFAGLDQEKYFLIILGQDTSESPALYALATEKLKSDAYVLRTVAHQEVNDYYQVADVFVLASLQEGLPRVILEACAYGLAVVCHDYGINRETLENFGWYLDMNKKGALQHTLETYLSIEESPAMKEERIRFLYEHYSWDVLKERYITLIKKTSGIL
jgi:1,2-diacylglycerol 3-alpha-glucosyltransferase